MRLLCLILAACTGSEGYLVGNDDAVRAQSNRAMGAWLARAFRAGAPAATGTATGAR